MSDWSSGRSPRLVLLFMITLLVNALYSPNSGAAESGRELFKLTLGELVNINVTTVSRLPQTVNEAPGIVTVITVEQMAELGLRTIEDALRLVPGYEVVFGPRRSTVYARGVMESALVLIDGTPIVSLMDNEIFLDEGLSLAFIDRIEVIRGPGGVLWGPTAFVGVINIVTKSATDRELTTRAHVEYGSYDTRQVSISLNKKAEDWAFFATLSELRTDDFLLRSGEVFSPVTGRWGDGYVNEERRQDFFREAFLKCSLGDLTFTARLADEEDYYQFAHRGRGTGRGFDAMESDPVKSLYRLEYDHEFESFHLKSRLWSMTRESSLSLVPWQTGYPSGNIYMAFEPWETRQEGFESVWSTDRLIAHNQMLVGVSYIKQWGTDIWARDGVHDLSGGLDGVPIDWDWFVNDYGAWIEPVLLVRSSPGEWVRSAFLRDSHTFGERLTLSGGYRFDDNSAYEPIDHFSFDGVWEFAADHYFKCIYGEGFRPADWEQKNSRTVGGSDLEPEESTSWDFQYNAVAVDRVSYFINYAHTRIDNMIVYDLVYLNSGQRTIDSVEGGLTWYFNGNGGYFFTNYNYKYVTDAETGAIPFLANHITNLGIYWRPRPNCSATATLHYEDAKKQEFFPADYNGSDRFFPKELRRLDGFISANIGLQWQWRQTKMSIFCYNVFDSDNDNPTAEGRSYVPMPSPGRNLIFSLENKF